MARIDGLILLTVSFHPFSEEGCPELKAMLQWLAASEGKRRLLYFPFELKIGPATQLKPCFEAAEATSLHVLDLTGCSVATKRASVVEENYDVFLLWNASSFNGCSFGAGCLSFFPENRSPSPRKNTTKWLHDSFSKLDGSKAFGWKPPIRPFSLMCGFYLWIMKINYASAQLRSINIYYFKTPKRPLKTETCPDIENIYKHLWKPNDKHLIKQLVQLSLLPKPGVATAQWGLLPKPGDGGTAVPGLDERAQTTGGARDLPLADAWRGLAGVCLGMI